MIKDKPAPAVATADAAVLGGRQRRDRLRRSHRQDLRDHPAASSGRNQSQTPAAARRRQGKNFLRLRTAQARRRRRPHAQRQKHPQLCLRRCPEDAPLPRKMACAPSSKALSSATSIPTTTRATARMTRKLTRSPSSSKGDPEDSARAPRHRPHRRRIAELHPRPGERTLQSHDADHARRARQKDGAGSWTEVRSPTAPTKSKN